MQNKSGITFTLFSGLQLDPHGKSKLIGHHVIMAFMALGRNWSLEAKAGKLPQKRTSQSSRSPVSHFENTPLAIFS
jgi:hypothetical protein